MEPPPEAEQETASLTVNQLVAWNLQQARTTMGWTQAELARRLTLWTGHRWSNVAVSAAERSVDGGRIRVFDANDLAAFSSVFRLPIAWFFLPRPETATGPMYEYRLHSSEPAGTIQPYDLLFIIFSDTADDHWGVFLGRAIEAEEHFVGSSNDAFEYSPLAGRDSPERLHERYSEWLSALKGMSTELEAALVRVEQEHLNNEVAAIQAAMSDPKSQMSSLLERFNELLERDGWRAEVAVRSLLRDRADDSEHVQMFKRDMRATLEIDQEQRGGDAKDAAGD